MGVLPSDFAADGVRRELRRGKNGRGDDGVRSGAEGGVREATGERRGISSECRSTPRFLLFPIAVLRFALAPLPDRPRALGRNRELVLREDVRLMPSSTRNEERRKTHARELDEDDTLTEVGEDHDFGDIDDETDAVDRRRDPLRSPY